MRILLAEDDTTLNASLAYQLESRGFTVDPCFDGEEALFLAEQNIHDVILLDRMLPGMEGTEVLKALRKQQISIPIILITALGTLSDKVTGLDLGADDYLVKPFALEELLARIRSVTRRPHSIAPDAILSFSDSTLNVGEHKLQGPNCSCTLSKKENALLEILIKNHDHTIHRTTLLLKVWGPDSNVEEGNLDNYIHFLRRRLLSTGSSITIQTVRGIGYCLQSKQ